MLWKLDGVSEYNARRPLTPTGTNLLGLVKHLAYVEAGYFGDTFGRPFPAPLPANDDVDAGDETADLWVRPEESREYVLGLYRTAWRHAEETFAVSGADTVGRVPWWPAERAEVSLHRILVHVVAETAQHAGHLDILREGLDGAAGLRPDSTNLPEGYDWPAHVARVQAAADRFR